MARKLKEGEVNKSQEIRDLLTLNPKIKASEAVAQLAQRGIKIAPGLFYFIKGRMGRRRKQRRHVEAGATAGITRNGDVLATIKKIKGLAGEVGGLKKLKALVEELSE
jgi:hypothetical protein